MKASTRELLTRVAWQVPAAAVVAYGVVGNWHYTHLVQSLPDNETGRHMGEIFKSAGEYTKTAAELLLAYAVTFDIVARARAHKEKERHKKEKQLIDKAEILRPPPADLGVMVTPKYFREVGSQEAFESAKQIISDTKIFKKLSRGEKDTLQLSRNQHVFATTRHIILLDPSKERDLVKASAARGTLLDESTGKTLPLLKPAAIRMAVEMGQYENEETARETWDIIYDQLRGKQLLKAALLEFPSPDKPGAVVMDGAISLRARNGIVLPWGDYRYIGCEKIEGIETPEDAVYAATAIAQAGIRDADKGIMIKLRVSEIKRLAKSIYEDAIQQEKEKEQQSNVIVEERSRRRWLPQRVQEFPLDAIDRLIGNAQDADLEEPQEEILTLESVKTKKKTRI